MITCAIFKTVVTSDINLGNDANYYMDKLYFEKKKDTKSSSKSKIKQMLLSTKSLTQQRKALSMRFIQCSLRRFVIIFKTINMKCDITFYANIF